MAKQFLCGSVDPFTVDRTSGLSFSVKYFGLEGRMEYLPDTQQFRWSIPSSGAFREGQGFAEGLEMLCDSLIRLTQESHVRARDINVQTESFNAWIEAIPDDNPMHLNRLMELYAGGI